MKNGMICYLIIRTNFQIRVNIFFYLYFERKTFKVTSHLYVIFTRDRKKKKKSQ